MRRTGVPLGLAAAVLVAACSGPGVVHVKDPGPVPMITTTTTPDYGAVALKTVTNRATSTIPIGPGKANLSGTASGPDGFVPGATVRVERLESSGAGSTDVVVQPDGTWALPNVLGGRFRVRAFRPPDLAQTTPTTFFIGSSDTKDHIDLRMDAFTGIAALASIAPSPAVYGQPANMAVLLTQRSVDPQGVVLGVPQVGLTVAVFGSGYQLETSASAITDNGGVARWRLHCTNVGDSALSVAVAGGSTYPLTLPPCVSAAQASSTVPTTTTVRRTTTSR
jgi:hypothetical protein